MPVSDRTEESGADDTLELVLPDEPVPRPWSRAAGTPERPGPGPLGRGLAAGQEGRGLAAAGPPGWPDLLDHVGAWGPTATPLGVFHLVPVRIERDLGLIAGWMNDPAVAALWELAGPAQVTEEHLLAQLDGDGRSTPCVGVLDGVPMSYWEVFRADLAPLARHYPARPHDTGLRLVLGRVPDRGRGLGSVLLRAAAELAFDRRPRCARVVGRPDVRNTAYLAAFLTAGFRYSAELTLDGRRVALVVRDRALRHRL